MMCCIFAIVTEQNKVNMKNILYYPYINIPRAGWTLRVLLYYDNVGSIVPREYFHNPEKNYDRFMLELVRHELVTPIDPMSVLEHPRGVAESFLEFIEKKHNRSQTLDRGRTHHKSRFVRIHAEKFDEYLFYELQERGLAQRALENSYFVEERTADNLMNFLATIIGKKTNRLPTTDLLTSVYDKSLLMQKNKKREIILRELIPFPEDIDLGKLIRFKEKHSDLLDRFRTTVENIVLDPSVIKGSSLFENRLEKLQQRKQELVARMNESNFRKVLFGTVCGLVAGGVSDSEIGIIAGLAGAIHSVLQVERAEDVRDQTGLKYLALAEKRLGVKGI